MVDTLALCPPYATGPKHYWRVMAGLVPAIHVFLAYAAKDVDARHI
jgi:hypothetical protein